MDIQVNILIFFSPFNLEKLVASPACSCGSHTTHNHNQECKTARLVAASNSKHFQTTCVKKIGNRVYMNTLFGCMNKHVFYLEQQQGQRTHRLRGHRPYWGLGQWELGWTSAGTKLRLIISALSSTNVVATGKTDLVLANRKDLMEPKKTFTNRQE